MKVSKKCSFPILHIVSIFLLIRIISVYMYACAWLVPFHRFLLYLFFVGSTLLNDGCHHCCFSIAHRKCRHLFWVAFWISLLWCAIPSIEQRWLESGFFYLDSGVTILYTYFFFVCFFLHISSSWFYALLYYGFYHAHIIVRTYVNL